MRLMRLPLSMAAEGSNGVGWAPGTLAEAQQAKTLEALKVLIVLRFSLCGMTVHAVPHQSL